VTKEEALAGLQAGHELRVDRKDEPLLPWLLLHPNIENQLVQVEEQYSYIKFWWNPNGRADNS
jgi:hypothetical protein